MYSDFTICVNSTNVQSTKRGDDTALVHCNPAKHPVLTYTRMCEIDRMDGGQRAHEQCTVPPQNAQISVT